MATKIIMLSGKQASGKSTLTDALIKRINAKKTALAVEVWFAAAIYNIHNFALQTLSNLGIWVPEKDGDLLQMLGTEWGRAKYGEDVWVNAVKGEVLNRQKQVDKEYVHGSQLDLHVIISDCRFRNEFDGFPDALRVRLMCNEAVRCTRSKSWREAINHPSEIDLDGYSSEKKFDLYLDTQNLAVAGCVDLVLAQLDKNNWKEKRK